MQSMAFVRLAGIFGPDGQPIKTVKAQRNGGEYHISFTWYHQGAWSTASQGNAIQQSDTG